MTDTMCVARQHEPWNGLRHDVDMDGTTPGERLRGLREKREMSAGTLAERAGVAESTVRAHENGQNDIRPKAADRYASILRCTPEWLLYGTGDVADHLPAEADAPKHYARAWREYRGLTVTQLARRMSTTDATIEGVELGDLPLSGKRLQDMATALETTGGRILSVDPNDVPPEALDAFGQVPPENRPAAIAMLRGLAGVKK